jgi:hypothetical protein
MRSREVGQYTTIKRKDQAFLEEEEDEVEDGLVVIGAVVSMIGAREGTPEIGMVIGLSEYRTEDGGPDQDQEARKHAGLTLIHLVVATKMIAMMTEVGEGTTTIEGRMTMTMTDGIGLDTLADRQKEDLNVV